MTFVKGQPGGPGRPKGVPNKATASMKAIVEGALARIDAEKKLAQLAESDEPTDRKTFWGVASKLIPANLNVAHEGNVTIRVVTGVPEPEPAK